MEFIITIRKNFPKKTMKEKTMKEDKIIKNLPFASYNERLNSFQNWPIQLLPSKEQLSRAGFIYLNIGDQVQCFYCNLKLKEWKRSDNAFEEHKKHTQDLKINCLFVKS